jgi:hypothetical protein
MFWIGFVFSGRGTEVRGYDFLDLVDGMERCCVFYFDSRFVFHIDF